MRGFVLHQSHPSPSKFDRFRDLLICFILFQKGKEKTPTNDTLCNFFPKPQPPGPMAPLPKDAPDHGGATRQSFIPIGPNGAPVMPIRNF